MLPLEPKAFFVSLWIETLFYGFHLVLFCFCVFILLRRKRQGYSILLAIAIAIFAFSTTHFILVFEEEFVRIWEMAMSSRHHESHLRGGPHHHHHHEHSFFGLNSRSFAYLMNSLFADALVIYRCYAIWNFNTDYIAGPVLLLLITTMVGAADPNWQSVALQLRPPYFVFSLITNVTVTCMAAGRLWWMARNARVLLKAEPEVLHRYQRAGIIVLETGALYSVIVLVFIVLCLSDATEGAALIVQDALAQIMGILPTLTIVTAGLGFELSSSNTASSNAEFRKSELNQTRTSFPYHRIDDAASVMNIV